jgi:hypothetical protein
MQSGLINKVAITPANVTDGKVLKIFARIEEQLTQIKLIVTKTPSEMRRKRVAIYEPSKKTT